MAGITGQSTTFNLPNYVGELFALTPTDTPLLSMIGGLTGGERTTSSMFQWQTYDLRDASQNVRLEGADAPTAEARVRANVTNVVEVHQETIETSYTKQAAVGQLQDVGSAHTEIAGVQGVQPVGNEHNWQTMQMLKQIARDVEFSLLLGIFAEPSTNATARQTRGLWNAITTNDTVAGTEISTTAAGDASDDIIDTNVDAHGMANGTRMMFTAKTGATGIDLYRTYFITNTLTNSFTVALTAGGATVDLVTNMTAATVVECVQLTEGALLGLMQDVWDQGGIMEQETATVIVNSELKRRLTTIFITDKDYREMSRDIAGVHVTTIETDFGILNVMLNRHMWANNLIVASLEELSPVILEVPDKGYLFQEPLSKIGAAERTQLYGEIGLKYGNEREHGRLVGVQLAA